MNQVDAVAAIPSHVPLKYRVAARLVLASLSRWKFGTLTVVLPDDRVVDLGTHGAQPQITVTVKDWRFFWRALTAGDIGVGESYMDGDWTCSDLVALCRAFVRDQSVLNYRSLWTLGMRVQHWLIRWSQRNTLAGSRRNIAHHYDLSNDLYRLFLDESMTYSCAVFAENGASLADAQRTKIDEICRRLELAPGMEILEIGSGWGAFAMHAAREYGCRVTSLTLSEQQLQLAQARVREAGLASAVDIRLCDYRRISGSFDRIVSIEMFEAVGAEYYGAFFGQCSRLLKPGGRMLLQTITMPDQRFDAYVRDFDWVRKYIFPGGTLASVCGIARAVKDYTALRIEWMQDIGLHYVGTLRSWRICPRCGSSASMTVSFACGNSTWRVAKPRLPSATSATRSCSWSSRHREDAGPAHGALDWMHCSPVCRRRRSGSRKINRGRGVRGSLHRRRCQHAAELCRPPALHGVH